MFSAEAAYQKSANELITRLNHGLFRRAIEARFLTTFYGMLGKDGSLTYCNAGHNAPMLVAKSGVRRLETGGVVLGLFDHAAFDEETVTMSPGDLLVTFSDGVTEALNPAGEEFTDDRLIASIQAHRDKPLAQLVDAVLGDVRTFCAGATQSDDITLVMVRFNG
jgi:sigma-B regulation protein RsbU (phosphoserine phosphatase)